MKTLSTASLLLLLVTARCTFGQFKIHHTTYGAPFGVPSHGSTTYLSPSGANSLSSVLAALGIGPSSPNSQLTLTPSTSASGSNAAVPTFVLSNASNRNQIPSAQASGKATNQINPATNGQTVLRTSPIESAGGGPQQIPSESVISNQITSNPIGAAATSNNLASRFVPPPPPNTNTLNSNQETQSNAALESQSINLLNSLFSNLLSPNPSTPFSSLSSQTPFIVILPQGDSSPNGTPQPAQVIMNVDPTRNLQGNSPQSPASFDVTANDVISNVAQFMQANGLSTDLLRVAGSQGSGTPRIITVTPQVANQGLSSFSQETPVLVALDPATLRDTSRSGTSAHGSSTTGQNGLGNEASKISNQNVLNALTALAQSSPVTQSATTSPTAIIHSSNAPGTSGSGTTQVNALPPFPGKESVAAVTNAKTAGNVTPSLVGASPASLSGTAPNTSQVGAGSLGSTFGSPPRKNTKMIIPVIQDIRSLSRGAGGVYMYSFSIAGSDGITRHEVGEVAPGIRKISRTVSPAGIGSRSGAGVQGHSARNGGVNGATSADVATNTGANNVVDASTAAALAEVFNVFANYSYVDPNGQVFRLHYTHGQPNFVPQPPPEPLPPTAPHPFDFLLNKLTDLRVHHHLEPVPGATGTGATGTRATGTVGTDFGATGTGATETGTTGTGAIGTRATGTVGTDFGATGTGATETGTTGTGATGTRAKGHGTTGNGATVTGAAGKSAAAAEKLAAGGDILADGGGSTATNEVAPNELGTGAASSSGTVGADEALNVVDGSVATVAEEAATGADPTAAEAANNVA